MNTHNADGSSSPLDARRAVLAGLSALGGDAAMRLAVDGDEDLDVLRSALDRYEVLDRVDNGGQGTVYRAKQRGTSRTVAIKVLLDGPLASERQRYRFEREIELVSRLDHPNIVALHEAGVVRGRLYYSMDFVDGRRIDDFAILHDLSPREVVALLLPVCRAIHFAHQRGVIHRDLKPNHILIEEDGRPRVLDFGLAKDVFDDSGNVLHSCTGQVVGTLPYLAPEQAGGFDGKADVRSDVYALGLILYQLLTDLMPYPVDGSPEDVRRSIIEQAPLPLRKAAVLGRVSHTPRGREISRDLELILHRALAKHKDERYQTAGDLADDLERYLRGEAVVAVGESPWYAMRKTLRRHRVAVGVSSAIATTLVIATVLVSIAAIEARRQRDVARSAAGAAADMLGFALREIESAVRPLPGGVEVRDQLLTHLDDKIVHLRSVAAEDESLDPLTLTLVEKQGDMAAEKGDLSSARAAYADVLARIASERAESGALSYGQRLQHAVVLRKHGELSGPELSPLAESARLLRGMLVENPTDDAVARELIRAHMALARGNKRGDDLESAIRELDTAEAILGEPAFAGHSHEADRMRAALRITRSGIWRDRGRGGDALADLYSGLEILERVAAARPTDTDVRLELMRAYRSAGQVELQLTNIERAKDLQRKAFDIGERLAAMDPLSRRWDEIRVRTLHDVVVTLCDTGSAASAGVFVDIGRSIAARIEREEPGSDLAIEFRAISHELAGRVAHDLYDRNETLAEFSRALDLRKEAIARAPGNSMRRRSIVVTHQWLGYARRDVGDNRGAFEQFKAAWFVATELAGEFPDSLPCLLSSARAGIDFVASFIVDDTGKPDSEVCAVLAASAECLRVAQQSCVLADRQAEVDRLHTLLEERRAELSTRGVNCLGLANADQSPPSRP